MIDMFDMIGILDMFDYLKNKFIKKEKSPTEEKRLSPKEIATQNNEPYVNIIDMSVNYENLGEGSFELDWNDKFVADLVRAGYKMKPNDTDSEIVERWFQIICRNVALETWEQVQAMNPNRVVQSRNIGDGMTEVQ